MARLFIPKLRQPPLYLYVIAISVNLCFNIQARWALSGDDTLQDVGSCTGINYFNDFEEYLTILETRLRRRKKSILNIIKEWDEKIFPKHESSLVKGKKKDEGSGLKKAMDLFEANSEEEDIEGQGGNGGMRMLSRRTQCHHICISSSKYQDFALFLV